MSILNERVAERVRAVMASQRLSIARYAEESGQSQDKASRRVNGQVDFTLSDIEFFAELTGYTPLELMSDQFILKSVHPSARTKSKERVS